VSLFFIAPASPAHKKQLSYRKSWTEQEVEIIKTMYPDNLTENLPFLPGRSISKIMGKANLMG
jgi:hypothetical protein